MWKTNKKYDMSKIVEYITCYGEDISSKAGYNFDYQMNFVTELTDNCQILYSTITEAYQSQKNMNYIY